MTRACATPTACASVKRRGPPTSATMRAVADVLDGADFSPDRAIQAFAWPLLLQAAGRAAQAGGRLTLSARGRAALSAPS